MRNRPGGSVSGYADIPEHATTSAVVTKLVTNPVTSPPVLTALEAANYLRLDQRYTAETDRVAALHRLVRRCGLRPIVGIKPYVYSLDELRRFTADQTERFTNYT